MTKREQRVIKAFLECVKNGEFSSSYAITLIEDSQRYGWMSDNAKDAFYEGLDEIENADKDNEEVPEPTNEAV